MVRAADRNNYYAVKLVVAEAGPVPEVLIQRYAVIHGRPGPVTQKRLPVQLGWTHCTGCRWKSATTTTRSRCRVAWWIPGPSRRYGAAESGSSAGRASWRDYAGLEFGIKTTRWKVVRPAGAAKYCRDRERGVSQ